MSDIIERLHAVWEHPFSTDADPRALLLEAADEIARLRLTDAERETLERVAVAYGILPTFGARQVAATLRGMRERLT